MQTDQLSGWIFSKRIDPILFTLPLVFAAVAAYFFRSSDDALKSIAYFFVFELFANMGHVAGTVVPIFWDRKISSALGRRRWVIPTVVMLGSCLAYWFSKDLFWGLFGYFAIYHIAMQQYGLFRLSERRGPSPIRFKFSDGAEKVLIANLMVFPLYVWACGRSAVPFRWFTQSDLGPSWGLYLEFLQWVHFGLLLVYLVWQISPGLRGSRINQSKLLLTVTTWLWYYGGLVIAPNSTFFWAAVLLMHGATYMCFTLRYWRVSPSYEPAPWLRNAGGAIVLLLLGAMLVFSGAWLFLFRYSNQLGPFLPLVWAPLICHYALDSVIWRSRLLVGMSENES